MAHDLTYQSLLVALYAWLLSKPLGRTQYLVGKFVGIVIVGLVVTGLISLGFVVVHKIAYEEWALEAFKAHILTMGSIFPMAALALLFASMMTEASAAILTFLAIFVFNCLGSIPQLQKAMIIYGGIIPDLALFNLRGEASHGVALDWSYILLTPLWGILYSVALISITGLIFNRRDLK